MRKPSSTIPLSAMLAVVTLFPGCAEAPSQAARDPIRSSWEYPLAYAGPDEVTIKLTRAKDNKLYLPIKINGRILEALIDTGARSVFDLETMRAIGVASYPTSDIYYGLGGHRLQVHVGYVEEIDLGGLKSVGKSVTLIDLSGLKRSQTEGALPPVDGLIGVDLLVALSARIDYGALTLTLKKPHPNQQ
jgi:hypothetical protein